MPNPYDESDLAQRTRRLLAGRNTVRAGRALGELGARALPAIVDALRNSNPFVRSGALHGCAAVVPTSPATMAAIADALVNDADPRVRETACLMLAKLGLEAVAFARDALTRATKDGDARVVAAATAALDAR